MVEIHDHWPVRNNRLLAAAAESRRPRPHCLTWIARHIAYAQATDIKKLQIAPLFLWRTHIELFSPQRR
jgi:hypothetical protein